MDPKTDKAYAALGEQAHVSPIADWIAPRLGDLSGRSVLDFGCGEGHLLHRLLRQAAGTPQRVLGIDHSEVLAEKARLLFAQREPVVQGVVDLKVGDESALVDQGPFDVVLCSLMLMQCTGREQLHTTVGRLIDAISPHGRLWMTLTHPCFRRARHRAFHNRLPDGFSYWDSGKPYTVVMDPDDADRRAEVSDTHWMLQDYVAATAAGGGVIAHLHELAVDDASDEPPAYVVLEINRKAEGGC